MSVFHYFFTFFFLAFGLSAQSGLPGLQAAIAAEKPAEVISSIDSLVAAGRVSPDLYLLQGNTYYELGQLGRAVLAYERGLRLRPTHKALKNNLAFVEAKLPTVYQALPDFFLLRWWKIIGSWLGTTAAKILAIVAWWVAIALGAWWFFKREELSEQRRFLLLPAAFLCLLLAIFGYTQEQSRRKELGRKDQAVLLAPSSELRVAPDAKATLEREITEGLRLRILDNSQENYVKVALRNGTQGWVPRADMEVI